MIIKKIRYKGKVEIDYFEVWSGEEELGNEGDDVDVIKADCVSTQICPWCTKKYGLYEETERTPESVEKELKSYRNADPTTLDFTCGVLNCYNGAADYCYVSADDCEFID